MHAIEDKTHASAKDEEIARALANIPDVMWIIRERQVVYIGPNVMKMLGFTPEEIIASDLPIMKKALQESLPDERKYDIEYRIQRKDGQWIWIQERAMSHYERDGIRYTYGLLSDITQRKMKDDSSRAARERLEFVVSYNPAVVLIEKPLPDRSDLMSTFVSKSITSLLGFEPADFIGQSGAEFWESHVHPDDLPTYRANMAALWRDGHQTYAYRFLHKDGKYRWIHEEQRVIQDGDANDVVGYMSDISDKKQMEDEFRSTKEQLEYAVFSNPAVIYVGKPLPDQSDFIGTYISKSIKSIVGFEAEQLIGESGSKFWKSRVPPEDFQKYQDDVPALWRDGQHAFEYRFLHKNGKYRWIHEEERIIRDEQNQVRDVVGYWIDVTDRRLSEEKFHELFEACPISLWEEDFSSVKEYFNELRLKGISGFKKHFTNHPYDVIKCASMVKILNVNEATLKLYNAKGIQEIVDGLQHIITKQSLNTFRDELISLAEGMIQFSNKIENKTLNGETIHVNVLCRVVPGYEETLAKVLVCIVDLTPEKKLRETLLRSQRLAAIGETATMVGHDLRNPLQGISGAAYNIRKHLGSTADPSVTDMLGVIDNGVQYANRIVNDLLDFSRESQIHLLPTTTQSIVRQAFTNAKVPNNIRIEDGMLNDFEILADESKMSRVITNLIQNAVDAMPDGGILSISSTKENDHVSIRVTDTGVGIPGDHLVKLWNTLFTTKSKGMGLGLPICKRFIEAHGGTLSVETTLGKGSTFTATIPIKTASEVSQIE
ncbi:MAG: PAS domain-containing protein [Candidatus Bathyarchaeia archaeon]